MPLTPKKSFLAADAFVKAHQAVVDTPAFRVAAEAALLQMLVELPDTTDPTVSLACYHRLVGARQYLNQLLAIADKAKPLERPISPGNLDHNA